MSLVILFVGLVGGVSMLRYIDRAKLLARLSSFIVALLVANLAMPVYALNTQKWHPSTGQTSGSVVQTSETLPKYHFELGMNTNLANHPFEGTPGGTARLTGIVDQFVTTDILIGYGFADWFTASIDVPVNLYHNIAPTLVPARDKGGADLGDIVLSVKVKAYDAEKTASGLGLAFVPYFAVPTGESSIHFGDVNATGGLNIVGDWKFYENRVALNIGGRLRKTETITNLVVENELTYGALFQRPLSKSWNLDVIGEVFGSTTLTSKFIKEDISSPLETDVTLRKKWGKKKKLVTDVGAGTALTNGYGLPNYRIFAGLSYAWDLTPKNSPKPRKVRIDIPTEVLFDFDKYQIKEASFEILNRFASQVAKLANTNITIEGHTDSLGSDSYNQLLSQRRANSIKAYLVKQGVAEAMLTAQGFGESKPVADNATEEGRQANRRVVFIIDSH